MSFYYDADEYRPELRAYTPEAGETEVVIPDGIKMIRSGVFKECRNITSVVIPEGLESILWEAFMDCSSLKSVTVPESVERIETDAFAGTPWLGSLKGETVIVGSVLLKYEGSAADVVVPEGVKSIGSGVFQDHTEIESVTLPEGLRYISDFAFAGCTKMKSVNIPESTIYIGRSAFENCRSLQQVTLPKTLYVAVDRGFRNCVSLKEFVIPASMSQIPSEFLMGCRSLERIVIEPGCTEPLGQTIRDNAFRGCTNLKSIFLPAAVDTMLLNPNILMDCDSLEEIEFEGIGRVVKTQTSRNDWRASALNTLNALALNEFDKSIDPEIFYPMAMRCYLNDPESKQRLLVQIGVNAGSILDLFARKSEKASAEELREYAEFSDVALYAAMMGFDKDSAAFGWLNSGEIRKMKKAADELLDKYVRCGKSSPIARLFGITCERLLGALLDMREAKTLSALLETGFITREQTENAIQKAIDGESHEIYIILVKYYNEHFGAEPNAQRFGL